MTGDVMAVDLEAGEVAAGDEATGGVAVSDEAGTASDRATEGAAAA